MSKIFIGIITGPGEYDNLIELCSVSKYFDGLAVTYHGRKEDKEYIYLDNLKKDGFIECIDYVGHHAHSMNHFLFNPKIQMNDWILLRDSSERICEEFAKNIKLFIQEILRNNINTVYQYSKLLLFRRFPQQVFFGTPHWGFSGARSNYISIEKMGWFKDDKEYCYSEREKRDKYHWVGAYFRYYLLPDSNHTLLGNCNRGNELEIFVQRESLRARFREYLKDIGVAFTVKSIIKYWTENLIDDKMREFINQEKILNDAYRFFILEDKSVKDEHDWVSIKKI